MVGYSGVPGTREPGVSVAPIGYMIIAVCCVPSMVSERLGVLNALNLQCFQHTIGTLECSCIIKDHLY